MDKRPGQGEGPPRGLYGTRAQSTLEYAILLALVSAALVAMHTYVNRALKANLELMDQRLTPSAGKLAGGP